jgi:hypothetical protein
MLLSVRVQLFSHLVVLLLEALGVVPLVVVVEPESGGDGPGGEALVALVLAHAEEQVAGGGIPRKVAVDATGNVA